VYGALAFLVVLLVLVGSRLTRSAVRFDSLAVLPVPVLPGDTAQEHLAEGMTDLLITHLSELSGLRRVAPRTAVMEYVGTQKSSRQIGQELDVSALVKMSVVRTGERVLITVNLIDARAERILWSDSVERPMRDVLALEQEIARSIARELRVPLTPGDAARLTKAAHRLNPNALEFYLQGMRANDPFRALPYFEQAIAADSEFALPYAQAAHSYMWLGDSIKANRAIARALELDPSLSDAYATLGLLRMWVSWDWAAAEAALRHSIELNPHNSKAHHELGQLLMRLKRCDEAVVEEQRAVLEDPRDPDWQAGVGEVYFFCRRYQDAIHEFEKTLPVARDSAPIYRKIAEAYFFQRNYATALAYYEKTKWVPGWAHVPLGGRQRALAQVDTLEAQWDRRAGGQLIAPFNLARLYTALGEREKALTTLERLRDAHAGGLVYLKVDPHLDPLREESRFQALLKKVGLIK
jgi:TolB-like protein/Flp pilus assembly protein TadD